MTMNWLIDGLEFLETRTELGGLSNSTLVLIGRGHEILSQIVEQASVSLEHKTQAQALLQALETEVPTAILERPGAYPNELRRLLHRCSQEGG